MSSEIEHRDWRIVVGDIEVIDLDMRAICRWPSGEVDLTMYHPDPRVVSSLKAGAAVQVLAGYLVSSIIGSGAAIADSVEYDTASVDRPLTVQLTPLGTPSRAVLSASWPSTSARTVLEYIADAAGLELDDQSGQSIQYRGGYHLSGGLTGSIAELAEDLSARWTVDGNVLRLWPAAGVLQVQARVWAPDTGLMYASASGDGIRAVGRLDARLRPGQIVRLLSDEYDGDIRVTECVHEVDTSGDTWQTTVLGVPYG